ncbi:hypothetical protein ABPG77_005375 [Micractinium sp. CCAP 211/92]
MGANWSKNNAVHVLLDKPAYQGGETVHTTVALNLVEPLTIANVGIRVRATEKTCWATTYSGGWGQVDKARNIDRGGSVLLMETVAELPGAAGHELAAGLYQWDVRIQLPAGAPPTFEQDWGDAGAYLSYEVSVLIEPAGKKRAPLHAREFINVQQHEGHEMPGTKVSEELALGKDSSKLNPLAPHGTVLASLTLAQESCLPGGQLEVALALDNRSGAAVKHVEVGLEREIMLQEEPGCVASQNGFREMCSQQATAEGVPAGAAAERHVRLAVPREIAQQPSLRGKLIRCDYFVKATLKMGMLAEDVHVKIPVLIQAAQGVNGGPGRTAAAQKPPSDLRPAQVFPSVALKLQ